jgi:proline iminopeptidase
LTPPETSVRIAALLIVFLAASFTDARDGYVETNGTRLYFKTLGTGEPIVVLHGGPGFDHRQFLPFIWDLAARHQVILYDQRGTGLSEGPVDADSITIENFIADIEGIREAFGIREMNLLGHSWGGMLAMHYAVRHPDRLRSLILVSTAASSEVFSDMRTAITAARPDEDTKLLESITASDEFRAQDPQALEHFWRVYFRVYFADPSLVSKLDLELTENTIRHSETVAGHILQSAGAFDLHEQLKSLQVPTLVLHGDSDPMPMRYAEQIHASLPHSELVVLERSGHWVFVDAMDQVRENVERFLARPRSGDERETRTYRGTLSRHVAIGGESTGYVLTMNDGKRIELALPERLRSAFEEGKHVTVEGRFEQRSGVEIPSREVFTVTKMTGE